MSMIIVQSAKGPIRITFNDANLDTIGSTALATNQRNFIRSLLPTIQYYFKNLLHVDQ